MISIYNRYQNIALQYKINMVVPEMMTHVREVISTVTPLVNAGRSKSLEWHASLSGGDETKRNETRLSSLESDRKLFFKIVEVVQSIPELQVENDSSGKTEVDENDTLGTDTSIWDTCNWKVVNKTINNAKLSLALLLAEERQRIAQAVCQIDQITNLLERTKPPTVTVNEVLQEARFELHKKFAEHLTSTDGKEEVQEKARRRVLLAFFKLSGKFTSALNFFFKLAQNEARLHGS